MLGARIAVTVLIVVLATSTAAGFADSRGPEGPAPPASRGGEDSVASVPPVSRDAGIFADTRNLLAYERNAPGVVDGLRNPFAIADNSDPASVVRTYGPASNIVILSPADFAFTDAAVTIVTSPGGLDVIVNGTRSASPVSFVGPLGAKISIGAPSPQQVEPGTRHVWTSWSDLGDATHVITIGGAKTLVAGFQTEYRLTVEAPVPGSGGDRWYSSGALAYAHVAYALFDLAPGERLAFYGWSGDASGMGTTSDSLLMDGPKVAIARYSREVFLDIETPYGRSIGSRWHTPGTRAYAVVAPARVDVGAGARQVFAGWSGDAAGSTVLSDPIIMDGPKRAVATWRAEFLVSVESQFPGVRGEGWYAAGSVATLEAPPQVASGPFIYGFAGWNGDIVSSGPAVTFVVDRPITVVATWALPGAFGPSLSILVAAGAAVVAALVLHGLRRRRLRSLGGGRSGR